MFNNFEFQSPYFLWLLILVPFLAIWSYMTKNKNSVSFRFSSLSVFKDQQSSLVLLRSFLPLFRILAIAVLIVALARPRNVEVSTKIKSNKGIDIVMAIDVSGSMLARDLKPNRLESLKKVAKDFVNKRPNDRIGVVLYAGESFTQTPITSDKSIVNRTITDIQWGRLDDGTAIGMGLGSAVNRLKESKAKSKVIILLTDGVNNGGVIDPKTATELAKELGIKVYTIGIGTNGMAESPVAQNPVTGELMYRMMKVEIDQKLLKHMAKETGGRYFRATSNQSLKAIYDEINKLEKTEIEEFKYYNYTEQYRILVFISGLLLLIEFLLKNTVFKSFV